MEGRTVRVGNIFHDQKTSEILTVVDTSETVVGFMPASGEALPDDWAAVPVILTDEILRTKCGFIPCGIIDDEFTHGKNYRFKLRRMEDGSYQFNAHRPIYLKHLHKLQNLFFEIEGEELEVTI